jgi:hypothetical protein
MKTVCVGRFLIDLPEGAILSRTQTFIDGFHVSAFAETTEAFERRVAARQSFIEAQPNELRRKNLESVGKVDVNGFVGKMFIFGRNSSYTMELGKRNVWENVIVEAYVHSEGISFDFISDGYDPRLVGNLPRLIKQLRPVAASDIPLTPGFCFGSGMFLDPLSAEQGEGTTIFTSIAGHPDIAIVFSTMAGTRPGPGLIERSARAAAREPFWARAAFQTLREGKRSINGLAGEEIAVKVTELNFSTVYGLDWEMAGAENDVLAPFLHLEMETGRNPHAGGKPVQSSLAQPAVLELWDKISSSIRLRPSAPVKASSTEPVTAPLGSFASAGEVCPQTGWWQCGDAVGGVAVLGGQRQFLREGQRMPQALLLPPQTGWEKLRGVQRSYEAATPTSWKLADKRTRTRHRLDGQLAQAAFVPHVDAQGAIGAASVPPEGAVPVGTHVKTGDVCPASGWWRCEEAQALDGTRWFAQGSPLPVATFQVPKGLFGKTAGGPETIQRRSDWQLVRHAGASGDGTQGPDGAGEPPATA